MENRKMNAHKIEVFDNEYECDVKVVNIIKTQRNKLCFRQAKLFGLMREFIKKYSALGFSYETGSLIKLECSAPDDLTFHFSAVSFHVLLEKRNVKFSFTPNKSNAGDLIYDVKRFNNGEPAFVSGVLTWRKGVDSEVSNWFLNVNSATISLKDSLFDREGIKMILTNMYLL